MEGRKFSSSRGVVIFVARLPRAATTPTRCATSSRSPGPETQDTDFTWSEFVRRNNDELVATWGNLVNRTLQSVYRNFGEVPAPGRSDRGRRALLRERSRRGFDSVGSLIEAARFRAALQRGDAARRARQPVRQRAGAVDDARDGPRAGGDDPLRRAPRCVDNLKVLFSPFLPFSSQRLHELLGYDDVIAGPLEFRTVVEDDGRPHVVLTGDYASWVGRWEPSALPRGQTLREPEPLFAQARSRAGRRRGARADGGRAPQRVTDSHAHLDACERAGRRARRAGARTPASTRIVTIGTGIDSCRAALAIAERARRACSPRSGSTRTRPATPRRGRLDELRELLAHPKAVARRRDRARHRPPTATPARAARASSTRSSRSPTSSACRS